MNQIIFVPNSTADPFDAKLGLRYYTGTVTPAQDTTHVRAYVTFAERVSVIKDDTLLNDVTRRARASGHVCVQNYPCTRCGLFYDIRMGDGVSRDDISGTFKHGFVCTDCREKIRIEAECRAEQARIEREQETAENRERLRKKYGDRIFGDCPECTGFMVARSNRSGGLFVGCTSYPECLHTMQMPQANAVNMSEMELAKKLLRAEPCPQCGSPVALREGKFGQFYGCCDFPRCRYTANIERMPQEADEIVMRRFE